MSMSSLLREKAVVERFKPFRPTARKVTAALRVPPAGGSPQLVGAAFDYLLRFELQRRAPHASDRGWTAEIVPDYLYRPGTRPGVWVSPVLRCVPETGDTAVARTARKLLRAVAYLHTRRYQRLRDVPGVLKSKREVRGVREALR